MSDINLLTRVKETVNPFSSLRRSLIVFSLIGTLVFFIGVFFMISMFIVNSSQLAAISRRQRDLVGSIESMKKTESQYILVKNRAELIAEAFSQGNAIEDLRNIYGLAAKMPENTVIDSLLVKKDSAELDFKAGDTFSLSDAFSTFITQSYYKQVLMTSFNYNNDSGYSVVLEFNKNI